MKARRSNRKRSGLQVSSTSHASYQAAMPDRTSPADRPGWCTSGLSAGYVPPKPRMERSSPVASGLTPGADSPGHLVAIALISTSCTAVSRQGPALQGIACAVGGLCHTREQIIQLTRPKGRSLIPVSDTAGKAGETIVGFGNRLCAALRLLPVAA